MAWSEAPGPIIPLKIDPHCCFKHFLAKKIKLGKNLGTKGRKENIVPFDRVVVCTVLKPSSSNPAPETEKKKTLQMGKRNSQSREWIRDFRPRVAGQAQAPPTCWRQGRCWPRSRGQGWGCWTAAELTWNPKKSAGGNPGNSRSYSTQGSFSVSAWAAQMCRWWLPIRLFF